MNLVEQINSHKYLYLGKLIETNDFELEIWIDEARLEGDEVASSGAVRIRREIIADKDCNSYKITFDGYVNYSVTDESCALEIGSDKFEGRLLRKYSKSTYLDYMVKTIDIETPGIIAGKPCTHYEIVCLNHIIDVLSINEPKIEEM